MIKILFMVIMLLTGVNTALAEIYKWVDQSGKIHFGDAPDNTKTAEKIEVKVNSYEHIIYEDSDSSSGFDKHVTMYATSWCGYCKKARNYFRANSIDFTEYDIEKSKRAKKQYDALGGKGVPVILIGDKRMNGFSEASFERIDDAVGR